MLIFAQINRFKPEIHALRTFEIVIGDIIHGYHASLFYEISNDIGHMLHSFPVGIYYAVDNVIFYLNFYNTITIIFCRVIIRREINGFTVILVIDCLFGKFKSGKI